MRQADVYRIELTVHPGQTFSAMIYVIVRDVALCGNRRSKKRTTIYEAHISVTPGKREDYFEETLLCSAGVC